MNTARNAQDGRIVRTRISLTRTNRLTAALIELNERGVQAKAKSFEGLSISGKDVCKLMRRHKTTIRKCAERGTVTQKRVREWRNEGVKSLCAADAILIITGFDIWG